MKMNFKTIFFIILLVILSVFLGLSIFNNEEEIDINQNNKEVTINWNSYSNNEMGLSFKVPDKVFGSNRCVPGEDFYVPLKIIENNEDKKIYIVQEYRYLFEDNECKKTEFSLSEFEKKLEKTPLVGLKPKPSLGWQILFKTIKSEESLNSFIKEEYGSSCLLKQKNPLEGDVFEVIIEGKDWKEPNVTIGNTTCLWNYQYYIMYSPKLNKLISINLGQECTFGTNPEKPSFRCLDEEIIQSFKFF